MPILENINFSINIDSILKSQGADPEIIRRRSPKLVEVAEKALEIGLPLLEPKILFEDLLIEKVLHEKIFLPKGKFFKGPLISEHLSAANSVSVIICTIGDRLEKKSLELINTDPVLGLAVEGVGSAATEALANSLCNYFDGIAKEKGWESTIPLNPGMIGWPVDEGQTQIFNLLDSSKIDVELTSYYIMLPKKTLSMVIGFGSNLEKHGDMCSYCSMNEHCQYKSHHSENEIS